MYQTGIQGIQISANAITTADFVLLSLSSTINGTVTSASSMQLLPGIRVTAYHNGISIASVLTNVNGQYVITGLSTGKLYSKC